MNHKNKIFIAPLVLIAMLIVMVFGTGFVPANLDQNPAQQAAGTERTFMLTGNEEVQSVTDMAVVWLGVQTEADTAKAAMDENNTKMQALVDSLKASGIKTEDIQTKRVSLYPQYQQDGTSNNRTLTGYTANNTVQVRTTDLTTLGTLLDEAVAAGANTIDNIQFEISDSEQLMEQAREAAVLNAKAKAEQLADLTGATLGDVYSIQETSYSPGPVARDFAAAESSAPIAPGTQTISIQVQITWTLIVN